MSKYTHISSDEDGEAFERGETDRIYAFCGAVIARG